MLHLSHKRAWYDHVNERKIHSGEIPRLGGIGFGLAFIIIATFISFFTRQMDFTIRFLPCVIALFISLVFGVLDDFRPLVPRNKLLLQFVAALLVIIPGFTFERIIFLDSSGFLSNLGWLSYPITFLWLVGLTNAVNLIDGVDGLAGGLSALIALSFAVIFFSFTETISVELFCICLFGVLLGFLVFNAPLPRAKIFMGDGGSQFLGFALALLPLLGEDETRAALPVLYAAALLAIPIFDTIAAVWRRIRDHRRIDSPDTFHVHHKLLNLGFGARGVNAILYSLQIVLSVLVFISIQVNGWRSLAILGIAYFVAITFFAIIHFLNRRIIAAARKSTITVK
ncbi:MAG: undecaprenyl/decaprenyl-phosphate alpha-N-acetylglucosaminyl 1-phosphate transferase [Treponema sp.]|nr:undecaprenyl/decaprenyl-phosphate alpha-N-acetylglucosaminyl 1-phosphate transferase [Treponema sp.]